MSEVKKALKNDTEKVDLSILPLPALEEMARAFQWGEKKYGRYNYCAGFESHRLVAAAMRHLTSWQDGEDLDPESGASHLGHALASVAMLLHTLKLGTNKDTRYKVGGKVVAPSLGTSSALKAELERFKQEIEQHRKDKDEPRSIPDTHKDPYGILDKLKVP